MSSLRLVAVLVPALLLAAGTASAAASAAPWTRFPLPPSNPKTAVERGLVVFESRCQICHGDENDSAGTISLGFKYNGTKPALLQERRDLTPALVKFYVRHGTGMMPFFRKTELSDQEMDDVAAYLSRKKR